MKKFDTVNSPRWGRGRLGVHERVVSHLLRAIHDDVLAFVQALEHDAHALRGGTELHLAQLHFVVGAHDRDRVAALHVDQRLLGHGQRGFTLIFALDAHARVLSGPQAAVGVRKQRLELNRTGARVHLAIGGNQQTTVRIDAAIGQNQLQPRIVSRRFLLRVQLGELPFCPVHVAIAQIFQAIREAHVVDLAHRKIDSDRVELRHRGQQRGAVLPDQVADAHERQAGHAGNRRVDLGVRKVQLRLRQGGLRGQHLPVRIGRLRGRVIDHLRRDQTLLRQQLIALQAHLAVRLGGRRAHQRRVRGRDRVRIFARLDREQQLPLRHLRAVLVILGSQIALHTRANVRVYVAVQRAHCLDEQRQVSARDRRDQHGRRRGRGRLLLGAGRAGKQHETEQARSRFHGQPVLHVSQPRPSFGRTASPYP